MASVYETMTTPLIENTIMQKVYVDGVHKVYTITPADGYVLHDKASDFVDIDPETGEEITVLGFNLGTCSCAASYDFTVTTTIDGYTAYGSRGFFARPANEAAEIM